MRVVLDTNVLVSAFIAKAGKPAHILRNIGQFELLASDDMLAELGRVLRYPRIQRKYQLDEQIVSEYVSRLREASTLVEVRSAVRIVTDDPDDDKFFACAIDGNATHIVSGDPHLLTINTYQGI